jgi:hypothetical protein
VQGRLKSRKPVAKLRLRRVIVLETFLVALAGFMVWGIVWEIGFPTAGLVLAIILWLTISPAIEIATVMKYRQMEERRE